MSHLATQLKCLRFTTFVITLHDVRWCCNSWEEVEQSIEELSTLGVIDTAWVPFATKVALVIMECSIRLCKGKSVKELHPVMESFGELCNCSDDDGMKITLTSTKRLPFHAYVAFLIPSSDRNTYSNLAWLRWPIMIECLYSLAPFATQEFRDLIEHFRNLGKQIDASKWKPCRHPRLLIITQKRILR